MGLRKLLSQAICGYLQYISGSTNRNKRANVRMDGWHGEEGEMAASGWGKGGWRTNWLMNECETNEVGGTSAFQIVFRSILN